jgi:membrane-associated phospholipid phosphatase
LSSTPTPDGLLRHGAQRGLWAILGLAAVCLGLGAAFDQELTLALRGWGGTEFATFMGRSLFEGDAPGAGDFGTIGQLAAIGVYLWAASTRGDGRWALRPAVGFVAFSGLSVGVVVQAVKVALARQRPGGSFTPFWELSGTAPEKLFGTGSFPSGHTAQIALLLAFVYAWQGGAPAARRAAAAFVLVLAGIMGLSRIVSFKHWLTDTIGSVFLCWLALHWSYYVLLRVPEQRVYLERWGRLPSAWPRLWELELFGWTLLASVSVASAAALWRGGHGLAASLPAVLAPLAAWLLAKRRRLYLDALGAAPE